MLYNSCMNDEQSQIIALQEELKPGDKIFVTGLTVKGITSVPALSVEFNCPGLYDEFEAIYEANKA